MRKLFIVLCLLVSFVFIGCATSKPAFHSKIPSDTVYLDPYNSWVNSCPVNTMPSYGKCHSPWRSITLRAINKKYRDVDITVGCFYDDAKFGERTVTVEARDDKTFTVWGLARLVPDNEKVTCRITALR